MKKDSVTRNYIVLPCCILLLNLCVGLVSYKAKVLGDPLVQVAAIMAMVLFGGSVVGVVLSPAIEALVVSLHRGSRRRWGRARRGPVPRGARGPRLLALLPDVHHGPGVPAARGLAQPQALTPRGYTAGGHEKSPVRGLLCSAGKPCTFPAMPARPDELLLGHRRLHTL
jgi:hypothetical protein